MTRIPSLARFRPDLRIIGFCRRTFYWGPFLVGSAVAFFLSAVPQTREVYLGILEGIYLREPLQILQAAVGLSLLILLCLLLHSWQRMLGTAAIDRIYPEHADILIDRTLAGWQRVLSRVSAVLPVLGLIAGLAKTMYEASNAGSNFVEVLEFFGGPAWRDRFSEFTTTTEILPHYANHGWKWIAGLAGLALLVLLRGRAWAERLLGRPMRRLYNVIFIIGAIVAVFTLVVPVFAEEPSVTLAQWLGPLAGAALFLISITSVLIGLSYLANRSRWPIGGGMLFAVFGVLSYLTYQSLTPRQDLQSPLLMPAAADKPPPIQIHRSFEQWLEARRTTDWPRFERQGAEYPVFVIAAQGGGIYAAAATTAFLAAMQDLCPTFSQHVFAISAVSGGAVGAAIFNALESGKDLSTEGCRERTEVPDQATLSDITKEIVRGDHLSPAVSLIWPDIARKILTLGRVDLDSADEYDRSNALESSFACALRQPGLLCSTTAGGLRVPFKEHWNPAGRAPALVLTSTWVETGYRAAFAPFNLHGASDGTVFTFPRSEGAKGDNEADADGDFIGHGIEVKSRGDTLIGAAMVSARFPGIVPAYVIKATPEGERPRRWNFVDGGYVDNSGATTAFEIYKALHQRINQPEKLPIEKIRLYLILMTDANTDPNLRDVDDGTSFSDTVAPVTAVLSVRGQLSGRAVTRAIEETQALDERSRRARAEDLTGRSLIDQRVSPVLTVNLQQKVFNLPLGWKISGTTDDIVRLMLGRPELCDRRPKKGAKNGALKKTISDNSCIKQTIIDLLSARKPEEKATAPN